jgi:hypothetical protein
VFYSPPELNSGDQQFGAKVWDVVNKLWRAAPPSPGAPQPNEDQSRLTPGLSACPRSVPAWRQEFHQEYNHEQRLRRFSEQISVSRPERWDLPCFFLPCVHLVLSLGFKG